MSMLSKSVCARDTCCWTGTCSAFVPAVACTCVAVFTAGIHVGNIAAVLVFQVRLMLAALNHLRSVRLDELISGKASSTKLWPKVC
jgi:hypothetical protein